MSLKHILVPLLGIETDRVALDAALAVAKPHGAHIQALHVIADPLQSTPMLVGVGFAIAEAADVTRKHSETLAKAARTTYDTWMRERNVAHADHPPVASGTVTTQFVTEQEQELIRDPLIIQSRLTDLIVFARPDQGDDFALMAIQLEDVLFAAGRPTLLVPKTLSQVALAAIHSGTALIAWNGSIEAVRAVQSLLDLLPDHSKVRVASVPEGHNDNAALELVRYLGWQGIEAAVAEVAKEGHTSQRLLQAAAEQQAGLLVMGAYSHGRLRQMVLGGVTRDMIHHAGLPVLLAH
ncbi:MAG TPA: universal stress protein [Dongiaceae bacterium]